MTRLLLASALAVVCLLSCKQKPVVKRHHRSKTAHIDSVRPLKRPAPFSPGFYLSKDRKHALLLDAYQPGDSLIPVGRNRPVLPDLLDHPEGRHMEEMVRQLKPRDMEFPSSDALKLLATELYQRHPWMHSRRAFEEISEDSTDMESIQLTWIDGKLRIQFHPKKNIQ